MRTTNRLTAMAFVSMATLPFAGTALGKTELQCNRKQTKCLTESHNLTIGDRVGIFNDEGELVAVGEVEAMRGGRRAVLINQRHGTIRRGYELALLDGQTSDASPNLKSYKLYKEPAKVAIGASGGLSNYSIGEGSPGSELSVYGQWRKWGGMQIIARGVYTAVEGEVSRYAETAGIESLPISVNGFGLLGGVGYVLRENKPLSLRGEFGLGIGYVSATIDGDASLLDKEQGFRTTIQNGVGAYGRFSLGVMWNISDRWHVHGDFAASLLHEALGKTLAAGVSMDLK